MNNDAKSKFIVGFGEVMLRLCPPGKMRIMQTVPGGLNATFGGGEANVCASLALFGEKARYCTALPDNSIAHAFMNQVRGLGVDTSAILLKKQGRMGVYFVETGSNQRPSNVEYDREYSVISQTGPDEYDFDAMLSDAKWLHLSGITPALSEKAFLSTLAIAEKAAEKGVTVSCDLNFRKKLWKWKPGTPPKTLAKECMEQIIPLVDVIIGNEEDASDVFGIHAASSDIEQGQINLDGYRDVACQLAAKFPKAEKIAITLRESISADHNNWGAMLFDAKLSRAFYAPVNAAGDYSAYQIKSIVDRVGGGDSFAAGLIFALNTPELSDAQTAVSYAVAASCLKHSIKGDFNYISKEEVISLMNGNAAGRVKR